jgi:hypothetical protein
MLVSSDGRLSTRFRQKHRSLAAIQTGKSGHSCQSPFGMECETVLAARYRYSARRLSARRCLRNSAAAPAILLAAFYQYRLVEPQV